VARNLSQDVQRPHRDTSIIQQNVEREREPASLSARCDQLFLHVGRMGVFRSDRGLESLAIKFYSSKIVK